MTFPYAGIYSERANALRVTVNAIYEKVCHLSGVEGFSMKNVLNTRFRENTLFLVFSYYIM